MISMSRICWRCNGIYRRKISESFIVFFGNGFTFKRRPTLSMSTLGVPRLQLHQYFFVDFDSKFGHRRLPDGYASALEYWDSRLPELFPLLRDGDLVLWTADHGNDPTWPGTDHTREQVPMIFFGPSSPKGVNTGTSSTFADMGATLAKHLQLRHLSAGNSVL